MATETEHQRRARIKALPYSRMVYPDSFGDRLKYMLWRVYTPCHPFVRNTLVGLGIVRYHGRQEYLLGSIVPERTIDGLIDHLVHTAGFGNHFVAWKDDGEVVSLRYVENFTYQYHLRVFENREVRGHYEYTPECYPIAHLREVAMEDRRDRFSEWLGDWVR